MGINVSNFTRCKEKYSKAAQLALSDELHLCATGMSDKGTCPGDSGSPLMFKTQVERKALVHKYVVVGITSLGQIPEFCASLPGVYTKVSNFERWIKYQVENIRPYEINSLM